MRMPSRLTLSAYVGPMPRPVVPILFAPRKRSVTLSTVTWYGAMTWALAETTSRASTPLTPRASSPSISRKSASGDTTTPLPITEVAPGVRMPEGSRWVAYFSPFTTMVWPALWPPLVRTTKSMVSVVARRSVAFPLPSSPHWAPRTMMAGIRPAFLVRDQEQHRDERRAPAATTATGLLRPEATKVGDPRPSAVD